MAVFLALSPPGSVTLWAAVGADGSEAAMSTSDALAVLLAALLAIAGSVLLVAARRLVKMAAAFDGQSGGRA
jgi:hypothetical protein